MDGPPQGSSGWQGVSQAEGGGPWGASVTWSNKEGQPAALEVGWLASKAQAAAARDLLQAWALQEQGQEVADTHLNLGLDRYKDVFPTLLALKTDLEVLGVVRQLNEDGVLASLVADVAQEGEGEEGAPPVEGAAANGDKAAAVKTSPRKRRAADKKAEQEAAAGAAGPGASPPTSPSRKRPASAAGNGNGEGEQQEQQQQQVAAAAAGAGEEAAGAEAAAEATPVAGGARAEVKSTKKARTGTHGEGDYQGITWAKGWTCQVHFVRKQLDKAHQSAMDAGRDRQTLHVVGFASAADAAIAADLAMLYRARVSGGAAAPKRYNFPPEVYRPVEERLYACPTIRDAKDFVKELRDSGTIATLRQGSSPAAAGAAAAGEAGTAAKGRKLGGRGRSGPKPKAQKQEQQEQQQQEEPTGVGSGELEAAQALAQAATAAAAADAGEAEAVPAHEEPAAAEPVAAEPVGDEAAPVAAAPLAPEPAGPAEEQGQGEGEPAAASPRSPRLAAAGKGAGAAGAAGGSRSPAKAGPAGRGSAAKLPKLKLKLGQPTDKATPRPTPRLRLKVKSPRAGAAEEEGVQGGQEGQEGAAGGEELRDPSKWMFILDTNSSWACQVAMASNKLDKRFRGAVRSESGRFTLRVTGFSRLEAATAADLGLMYRSHIYGEDVERQALGYNFPYSFYAHQPPGLIKKLLACKSAEDCKEYLAGLRDNGVIARLAEEAASLGRGKPVPAQLRGSEGEEGQQRQVEGEGEEEEQQRGGGSEGGSGHRVQSPRAAGGSGSARHGGIKGEAADGGVEAGPKKKRGEEVVGHGIRVYWPLDDEWYSGVVVSYDAPSQRHYVRYDDGEEMYLNLLDEQYKLTKRRRITLPPGHEILRADAGNNSPMRRRALLRTAAAGPSSGGATSPLGSQQQRQQPDSLDRDRPATTPGGKRPRVPRTLRELRMLQREEPGAGASKAQRVEGREGGPRGGAAAELELRGSSPQVAGGGEAGRGSGDGGTGRLPREEVEWMYSELKYMLHRTPGLADTFAQGFLSRYLQLHEAWRVQYREVKEAFDAGRHDLVREWVWCALEHS